jgi:hypothetical protein
MVLPKLSRSVEWIKVRSKLPKTVKTRKLWFCTFYRLTTTTALSVTKYRVVQPKRCSRIRLVSILLRLRSLASFQNLVSAPLFGTGKLPKSCRAQESPDWSLLPTLMRLGTRFGGSRDTITCTHQDNVESSLVHFEFIYQVYSGSRLIPEYFLPSLREGGSSPCWTS